MKFKDTAALSDAELETLKHTLDKLEVERREGKLSDKPMWLVVGDQPIRIVLPEGSIKRDFMSAVGHSIRLDRALVGARLAGRGDVLRKRAPRAARKQQKAAA